MGALKAWAVTFVSLLAIVGGLGGYKYMQVSAAMAQAGAMPEPMETVQAVTPRLGEWSASARAVGTIVSVRRVDLRNELSGTVTEVGFDSGAVVQQGQVLVRLDTREEEADLAAARADAELARTTLERRQRLTTAQAGSQAELDAARAQLAASRAKVASLETRIARKTLTAPFMARVGLRDLQPGAYLSEGTVITTLEGVDPDAYVDFSFPQDMVASLRPGTPVRVAGAGLPGGAADALILARDPRIDASSRSVRFRAVLRGLGDIVQPGAFMDVTAVTAAPRPALYVPLTAVRRAPYGDHVFALVKDGDVLRAQQRFVRLGPVEGEEVVVLEGLEPGQRLAAMGSFKLREGVAVTVGDPMGVTAPAVPQTADAGDR